MGNLYHLPAARVSHQSQRMLDLEAAGVCIFCEEHFAKEHVAPIVWRGEYWYVTANDYPYDGTKHHFLIVCRQHVRSIAELPFAAGADWFRALEWVQDHTKAPSAGIFLRDGDMRFNGGSVAHLHSHFIVGEIDDPGHQPVRVKLSSRDE
jgi:ATP adenylyltransferase